MDKLIHISPVPVPVIPAAWLGRGQASLGKENLAAQGATGKKRKSTEAPAQLGLGVNLDHINCTGMEIDANCDQVRRKINTWLDSGVMTKGAFCTAIGVSSKSLNGFLTQHGRDKGMGFDSYLAAWEFFKKREIAGLPMPKKQKTAAAGGAGTAAGAGTSAAVNISDVVLSGEDDDRVPVYDSCDEIRKKINAHLKTPGLTQAQFCRDLYAQLNAPTIKSIQSKQLADFRAGKGSRTGAKSTVFYTAYVYFEKLRIAQGKPKSKHRETMEEIWMSRGGFDRDMDHRT